jgi:hypothetical protein
VPIASTFERLSAYGDLCRASVGGPADASWCHLATLPRAVDDLFAAVARNGRRRADYQGASVAALLVDAMVSTALPALLVDRRLPDVRPSNLWARLHDREPWFEQIRLEDPTVRLLATDPDAEDGTAVVVASLEDLHRRLAQQLVEAATPWFSAVRALAPFGRRGMWGQLADDVGATALWTARAVDLDQRSAWEEAQAIVDHVAAAAPELRVRPRLFPVRWEGGETLFQVKGTCCLWYTTFDDPHRSGEGYCTTCPLRNDDIRHDRLHRYLTERAAG